MIYLSGLLEDRRGGDLSMKPTRKPIFMDWSLLKASSYILQGFSSSEAQVLPSLMLVWDWKLIAGARPYLRRFPVTPLAPAGWVSSQVTRWGPQWPSNWCSHEGATSVDSGDLKPSTHQKICDNWTYKTLRHHLISWISNKYIYDK